MCIRDRYSAPHSRGAPTRCSRYVKEVTTPKLPPPPRSPANSSGCEAALAVSSRPSAVTTSASTRLSQVSPYARDSQPLPPPSVVPAMPAAEYGAPGVASPKACVSWSKPPQVTPGCARAVRRSGSTRTPVRPDRSISIAPSPVPRPARLCPAPRTATGRPCSRATATACSTSATPVQRAITSGRRSTAAFHTPRARSYPSSPGSTISPRNPSASATAASAMDPA